MRHVKKYLFWLVLFLLSAGLVACRSNTQATGSSGTPKTTTSNKIAQPTTTTKNPTASTASANAAKELAADVTVTFDYRLDATAWLVKDVKGADGVAELDAKNPTLTFEVGKRYAFNSPQSQVHPFALRDAENQYLLAQGVMKGTLETKSDINFIDDGTRFAFTMTQALADAVKSYICTVHPPMVGSVEIHHGA